MITYLSRLNRRIRGGGAYEKEYNEEELIYKKCCIDAIPPESKEGGIITVDPAWDEDEKYCYNDLLELNMNKWIDLCNSTNTHTDKMLYKSYLLKGITNKPNFADYDTIVVSISTGSNIWQILGYPFLYEKSTTTDEQIQKIQDDISKLYFTIRADVEDYDKIETNFNFDIFDNPLFSRTLFLNFDNANGGFGSLYQLFSDHNYKNNDKIKICNVNNLENNLEYAIYNNNIYTFNTYIDVNSSPTALDEFIDITSKKIIYICGVDEKACGTHIKMIHESKFMEKIKEIWYTHGSLNESITTLVKTATEDNLTKFIGTHEHVFKGNI
jgi:hypothetical protein